MTAPPQLNKVPGTLFVSANTEKEKKELVKDITKLSKPDLEEILERQTNLLANKARLNRLPDKGKRIRDYYDKVLVEIEKRNVIDRAAELFSELNIASKGKQILDSLEWNGKYKKNNDNLVHLVDSDEDDEVDPLKIIAQSRDDAKRVKFIKPEPVFITKTDLEEIESFKNLTIGESVDTKSKLSQDLINSNESSQGSRPSSQLSVASDFDPHMNYLCTKETDAVPPRAKYKPYFTTVSNSQDPQKEKHRNRSKHWEITAATPPPFRHQEAKIMTLHESIVLQMQQKEEMDAIQKAQAVERLMAREKRKQISEPSTSAAPFFKSYRVPKSQFDDIDSDDGEEEHDDDDDESDSNDEEAWAEQEVHDDIGPESGGITIVQYEK